jgi:hypothetical protein
VTKRFNNSKFDEGLEVHKLGGSLWRTASGKNRYLKVQLAVTTERLDDIQTAFAQDILGYADDFLKVVAQFYRKEYYEEGLEPVLSYRKKLYRPLSHYRVPLHVEAINQYASYLIPPKILPEVDDRTIAIHKAHRQMLMSNWADVSLWEEEDFLPYLETNVNIGADLWITQNKKNFLKHFHDWTERHLKREYPFTLGGVLDMSNVMLEKKIRSIFTSFYRGKDPDTVRGVFGGPIPMKAIGAVVSALKSTKLDDYPKIGNWPWGAWKDWSELFPLLADTISEEMDSDDRNTMGEDITKFDTNIQPAHLEAIVSSVHDKVSPLYDYVLFALRNTVVWLGPYSIKNLYFVSGHPFTSEFGSLIHMDLAFQYDRDSDATLLHGTYQSDDNLAVWANIDHDDYFKYLGDRGYPIKVSGSSNYREHGYVRFLQNDIGRIKLNNDKVIFVGAFDSRLPKMIHMETGGEGITDWVITKNIEVDRMVSKLSSFGEEGIEYVEAILSAIRDNSLGNEVIHAIKNINSYDITSVRREHVGFNPAWLARVRVPDTNIQDKT